MSVDAMLEETVVGNEDANGVTFQWSLKPTVGTFLHQVAAYNSALCFLRDPLRTRPSLVILADYITQNPDGSFSYCEETLLDVFANEKKITELLVELQFVPGANACILVVVDNQTVARFELTRKLAT